MANPVASAGLVIEVLTTPPSTYTRVGRMFGYRRGRARGRTAIPLVTGIVQSALGPLDSTIDVTGLFTPGDSAQAFLVTAFEAGDPVTLRVTPVGGVGGSVDDYVITSAPDDGDLAAGAMHQGFTLVKAPAITLQPPQILNIEYLSTALTRLRAWRIMGNSIARSREKIAGSVSNRSWDMLLGHEGSATTDPQPSTVAPWSLHITQQGQYARAGISDIIPDNVTTWMVHLPVKLPARPVSGTQRIWAINAFGAGLSWGGYPDSVSFGLTVRADGKLGLDDSSTLFNSPSHEYTTTINAPAVGVWGDIAYAEPSLGGTDSGYIWVNGTRYSGIAHGALAGTPTWPPMSLTLGANRTGDVDIGAGAEFGTPIMYGALGTTVATMDAVVATNRVEFARLGYV